MRLLLALGISLLAHGAVVLAAWLKPMRPPSPVAAAEVERIMIDVLPLPRRGEGRGEGRTQSPKKPPTPRAVAHLETTERHVTRAWELLVDLAATLR